MKSQQRRLRFLNCGVFLAGVLSITICLAQEGRCWHEISQVGLGNLRVSETLPSEVGAEYCSVSPLHSYLNEIDQHRFLQACYDVCGEEFVEYFSGITWGKLIESEYCLERPSDISSSQWGKLQSILSDDLIAAHGRIRRGEEELMRCLTTRGASE
jgi:hypothetical protein